MKAIQIILVLFLACFTVAAQETNPTVRDVYLKIVDKKDHPLKKVVVQSPTSGELGITDSKGAYVFKNLPDSAVIIMDLPKYGKTAIQVMDMDSILVTVRSANQLSYSNERNMVYLTKDMTGSTDIIDVPTLLEQQNSRNLYELLHGRVAGLNMTVTGAGDVQTTIRGSASITQSNEPLVYLDGVYYGKFTDANHFLNVYDIKTIEIVKDGAGYGSRGGTGVIAITTKSK